MRLQPKWGLAALFVCLPALAAPDTVLVDAPQPLKRALERHLGQTNDVRSVSLAGAPTAEDVTRACLEQHAVAVVTGRLRQNRYTVTLFNGADGVELGSFQFRAPGPGVIIKFGPFSSETFRRSLAAASAPSPKSPEPEPVPVEAPPAPAPVPPVAATEVLAQIEPDAGAGTPAAAAPIADAFSSLKVVPTAYVEASYAYNFNRPANNITAYRGYDSQHNAFALETVAAGLTFQIAGVEARAVLQFGSTPSAVYLAEPSANGSATTAASSGELWKYVQEAWLAYRIPIGRGLRVQAGIALSPIGIESIAIKDNWNWSRSNLFFALPAYHLGAKASYELADGLTATVAGYNGWNDITDNNDNKSVSGSIAYARGDTFNFQLLYLGGVERPRDAPEGQPWRHLFDAYAKWVVNEHLAFMAQVDGGFERNPFGVSYWYAGAAYTQVRFTSWLALALRGDYFREESAHNQSGSASRLFFPSPWVSSGTATIEVRPHPQISLRVEYRHDQAALPMYFAGETVMARTATGMDLPNATQQNTVTVGATAWF